jgi:hypothetical protein
MLADEHRQVAAESVITPLNEYQGVGRRMRLGDRLRRRLNRENVHKTVKFCAWRTHPLDCPDRF